MSDYLSDIDMVVPVHADSFFSVSSTGEIHERLCFEYVDPEGYYRHVLNDEPLFAAEVERLADNMQYFLDRERVEINGVRVRSVVRYCDIFLKGDTDVVGVVYLIDFSGKMAPGHNRIETWLEREDAPYDFEIIWRFPVGTKVVGVTTELEYEVYGGDLMVLWAFEGDHVGGYEQLEFVLP